MRNLLYVSLLAIILFSCKKEEKTTDPVVPDPTVNYIPMHIGDYWVYKVYTTYLPSGNVDSTKTDSTAITRDTVIDGKTYFIQEGLGTGGVGPWGIKRIVRDSLGNLVGPTGTIYFSSTNFNDTLVKQPIVVPVDTIGYVSWKMKQNNGLVYTPFSTFINPLDCQGTILLFDSLPGVPNPRYQNYYYVPNIGNVYHSHHFLSGGAMIEEKLLRYHVGN